MRDPERFEARLAVVVPFAIPLLAVLLCAALPFAFGAVFTGGHPSGRDLGLTLAVLGFAPVLGAIGGFLAIRNFRRSRDARHLLAAVANAALVTAPAFLLAAA
jgi:hypothetical protein